MMVILESGNTAIGKQAEPAFLSRKPVDIINSYECGKGEVSCRCFEGWIMPVVTVSTFLQFI